MVLSRDRIKAIIFDLDNCLSAADEVPAALFQPAFDAMSAANDHRLSTECLAAAFSDCWRYPLDLVAERHGFSAAMLAAGSQAFSEVEMTSPMQGYPDLHLLGELPAMRFLVTSGFRRLQQSKVAALNVAHLFTGIYVDAIDEPGRLGKRGLFQKILQAHRLAANDVLVVGDNPESEIDAGNQLGIKTVQILRPGVAFGANARCHVNGLAELKSLLDEPG